MVFGHKVLAPGPGTRCKATFRRHPIESALSGSRFFKPPALPEVMTKIREKNRNRKGTLRLGVGGSRRIKAR